ncbi:hypothetical protein GCM10009038_15840 [Salinicola rhizosphaerae]|uniref:Uncharacterized protein n=1 Tax=Salinicola rhizosphaerae TaxID=1443141 RepID=A0ABQ3DVM1_9GAMM|nr:hypothetical protein GCM10009038_15840 [Salinicola rhizosphaerae]
MIDPGIAVVDPMFGAGDQPAVDLADLGRLRYVIVQTAPDPKRERWIDRREQSLELLGIVAVLFTQWRRDVVALQDADTHCLSLLMKRLALPGTSTLQDFPGTAVPSSVVDFCTCSRRSIANSSSGERIRR